MIKSEVGNVEIKGTNVDFYNFYHNYHGHFVSDLMIVNQKLKKKHRIYLVGDSSLDNKHWIKSIKVPAVNGYESIIKSGKSVPDISHCLNVLLEEEKQDYSVINCAVEESTLGARDDGKLLEQDKFVKNHLKEEDIIIASVGGNDIALNPSVMTILSLLWMCKISSIKNIIDGSAFGFGHFKKLFQVKIEEYLKRICENKKPKKILVCMIYYPHEKQGGWADFVLNKLNYDSNPKLLQTMIRSVFEHAIKHIKIEGIQIIPVPLFNILDPNSESNDYVARVEPSQEGGEKMAKYFYNAIFNTN